jgi:lia operon protein LiaF
MFKNFSRILWGLVFIAIGVALLMDRFGYIVFDLGNFLHDWWPLILVIIGLGMILDKAPEKRTK